MIKKLLQYIVSKTYKLEIIEDYDYNSLFDIYKKHWVFSLLSFIINQIYNLFKFVFPIFLANAYGQSSTSLMFVYISIYFFLHPLSGLIHDYIFVPGLSRMVYSVGLNINKYFLTADPIYHTNKSSGILLSKVNRMVNSIEYFLDQISFDFFPNILAGIVAVVYAFIVDFYLGLLTLCSILFVLVSSFYSQNKLINPLNEEYINSEDKTNNNIVENITSFNLIRASFAVKPRYEKTLDGYKKIKNSFNNYYLSGAIMFFAISIISALGSIFIMYRLVVLYQNELIDFASLISITLVAINGIDGAKDLGKLFTKISKSYFDIKDFFEFKNSFGKQSYKVLK